MARGNARALSVMLRCVAYFMPGFVLLSRNKPPIFQVPRHLPPIPMQLDNHPREFRIGTISKSAFLDLKRLTSPRLAKFRHNMLQNPLARCVPSLSFFFSYFSAHLSHLTSHISNTAYFIEAAYRKCIRFPIALALVPLSSVKKINESIHASPNYHELFEIK